MHHPPGIHGRPFATCALAFLLGLGPPAALAWDEEPTDSSAFETGGHSGDTGGDAGTLGDTYEGTHRIEPPDDADTLPEAGEVGAGTLDDTYQDTHRMEPPEGAEIVPADASTPESAHGSATEPGTDPQPDMESTEDNIQLQQPTGADQLDDTWEDTHTTGGDGAGTDTGTTTDPAAQIEQQMEQHQEDAATGEPAPNTPTDARTDPATGQPVAAPSGQAWMHRYDQVGLYGAERSDEDASLEGIFFYGYDGPRDVAQRGGGMVTVLSADLPVATKGDSIGEGYLGFGLQGGSQRLSLFATIGGVYARTVRASEETESDTAFGAEAGAHVGLGERTMVTAAIREDPNELIDENRVRLGLHIGAGYIGVRHGLDSDLSRLDLAVRF